MLVAAGKPFTISYVDVLQRTGLYVGARVFDVTSGVPLEITTQPLALTDLGFGDYIRNYTAASGVSYLVVAAVYTSSAMDTLDPNFAPWVENFDCFVGDNSLCNFNYGAWDENINLRLGATILDMTSGSPIQINFIHMVHVVAGCYFGRFVGAVGRSYLASVLAYTSITYATVDSSRSGASFPFVCQTLGGSGSVTNVLRSATLKGPRLAARLREI